MAASKTSAPKAVASRAKKTAGGATRKARDAAQPTDLLRESISGLSDALMQRASHAVTNRIESTTKGLAERAASGSGLASGAKSLAEGKPLKAVAGAGASRVMEKAKDAVRGLTGGKGGSGGKLKVTNIVESVDVGVPIKIAYDQWTQFTDFPKFMKKVEHVDQKSPERVTWKAQILWSHREWESKIVEQVPEERIVWTSKAEKGRVDGAVTFHELAPSLTRIVIVLAYHPQGLFEHVGNTFRAQGRRARLELKHFQRHVMTQTILHPDELEGWRGEIHDGEVEEPERKPSRSSRSSGSSTSGGSSSKQASKRTSKEPSRPSSSRQAGKQTSRQPSKQTSERQRTSERRQASERQRPARSRSSSRASGKAGTS